MDINFFDREGVHNILTGESGQERDLGDISEEAFDEIKDWVFLRKGDAGIAYKQCIKKGLLEENGDDMELHVYFTAAFGDEYAEDKAEVLSKLMGVMRANTDEASCQNSGRRIVSCNTKQFSDRMLSELMRKISKFKLSEEYYESNLGMQYKIIKTLKEMGERTDYPAYLLKDSISTARSVGYYSVADKYDKLLSEL
jgi:hypothetical protein